MPSLVRRVDDLFTTKNVEFIIDAQLVIIWCTFPTTNIAPIKRPSQKGRWSPKHCFFQVQQGVTLGNLSRGDVVAALREVGILEEQHGEIPEIPGEAE